jgi:hypothetical protein
MTIIQTYQATTGEICAVCGSDLLVTDPGGNEVVLECDCGPTAVGA